MDDCADDHRHRGAGGRRRTPALSRPEADPFAEPERLSVREAFLRHAGIDLFEACRRRRARRIATALAAQADAAGMRVARRRQLVRRFQPHTERKGRAARSASAAPPCLSEYPACEAALARVSARDPRVAERFELYACGVELANAFGELTDSAEQRRRFEAEMADEAARLWRSLSDRRRFSRRARPYAAGQRRGARASTAWSMLACGAERIEDVQWTPVFDPAASASMTAGERCWIRRARSSAACSAFPAFGPGRRRSSARCWAAKTCSRSCRPAAANRCATNCRRWRATGSPWSSRR